MEAPQLAWEQVEPDWPVSPELNSAALPRSQSPARKSGAAAPSPAQPPAQKGATPQQAQPVKPPQPAGPAEEERRRRAEEDARTHARRAFADLSQSASNEQREFVGRANEIANYIAHTYELSASELVHGHETDLDRLETATQAAIAAVELATDFAQQQLEHAALDAAIAIEAAGGHALALIKAAKESAAGEIAQAVAGLLAGHMDAYNGAIDDAVAACDDAVLALNDWRDTRAENYPTTGAFALEGAKNESRQARIPRWAESEATRLDQRIEAKKKAWQTSRDTSACSARCGYTSTLQTAHAQMVTQGQDSVRKTLARARSGLAEQKRGGARALRELRRSYLGQIETQSRSVRSRLTSQARSTLGASHNEAQGAITGVQSAARSSLPTYWRGPQGFEQSLRQAAPRGPHALEQTVQRGPQNVMQGIEKSAVQLDARLEGNRERFKESDTERGSTDRQSRDEQMTQFDESLRTQDQEANGKINETLSSLVDAFTSLSDTVAQAGASWAEPLEERMSGMIDDMTVQADAALQSLLTGVAPPAGAGGGEGAGGEGGEKGPDCSQCKTDAGADGAAAPPPGAAGGEAGPQGLTAQVNEEIDFYAERWFPDTFFSEQLEGTGSQMAERLTAKAAAVARAFEGGFAGTVDEEGSIAAVRGLTAVSGRALDMEVYWDLASNTLDNHLAHYLDDDPGDLATARAYLRGDAVEGARRELEASRGFFNDDEARIEATMRALSPEQLAELGKKHPDEIAAVQNILDGTDLRVFNALAAGNYALADAERMRTEVNDARTGNDADGVHSAIEKWTAAPGPDDWRSTIEVSADERREAVVRELGGIVSDEDVAYAAGEGGVAAMSAEDRAVAYVTRRVEVLVKDDMGAHVETRSLEGANRDLAVALLRKGPNSVEARASRLGVEIQRSGEPNAINIDKATFDERFSANLATATPEERDAHRRAAEDRARVVMLAAERYTGGEPPPEGFQAGAEGRRDDPNAAMSDPRVTVARDRLIGSLERRFGSETVGAKLAAGLLTDARPSAATCALAMRHAMYAHWGTNEELLFRFVERMDRNEIAAMRTEFTRQTGNSLDAEFGTYGEGGTFTELSGDDRLRMERALRGVARTDQEKLEAAAFALQQQRQETGAAGASMAQDTLAERVMANTERNITRLAGGPVTFGRYGALNSTLRNFNSAGRFTGADRDNFLATTSVALTVAENYAKRIDAFADVFTVAIAILGAIAAAVITVVTGGAAAPLIAAALVAGLASMAANYAIKGGRYGWEQAAVDLGMTLVQAVTAGVGAQLGAAAQVASKGATAAQQASRSIMTLSRIFTNNPIVNQIIIGGITGSIGGLGAAALNEQTWEGKDPVGALFGGLIRGALSGAATSAVMSSIENIGRAGNTIGARLQGLAAEGGAARVMRAILIRGGARSLMSAAGGVAGRGTELLFDSATGRFKGDAGEVYRQLGRAGLESAIRGFGEGAAESVGQRFRNRMVAEAAESIRDERKRLALPDLDPDTLHAAADDLLFMNQFGRHGGDGLGRMLNLEHVAMHGGMAATTVMRNPDPIVQDAMRAALARHIPPEMRATFADVPIRILSEAEFHALTRSERGPVVTLIEDGRPVVVVREGTPISRLADEGPHLLQSRDAHTRERVSRLDESVLRHWDSLDLDTQIGLYRNKIELEIDAHLRILRSLESERPHTQADRVRLAGEIERAEATLRNLHARLEEVSAINPARRAAIEDGAEPRPQYLDQPARLFSKDPKAPVGEPGRARPGAPEEEGEGARRPAEEGERRGYPDQPDLRGPRPPADPDSPEGLRQRHEAWVEEMRRGFLDPGSRPRMTEGDVPQPGRPPWHADIESAYAAYDALVRQHGGRREVGIVRNADTGEYMVVLGSPVDLRVPLEALRQETVLHYHPDYGPALYRGPSGTDLGATAFVAATAANRPVTEFIEFDVPGVGRGRTAFTVTPVADPSVRGGRRDQVDIEFINPVNGKYTHLRFASPKEWHEYYNSRTTALDPDSPIYRHILRAFKVTDAQIDALAARHRAPGEEAPPRPTDLPPPGRPTQAIIDTGGPPGSGGRRPSEEPSLRFGPPTEAQPTQPRPSGPEPLAPEGQPVVPRPPSTEAEGPPPPTPGPEGGLPATPKPKPTPPGTDELLRLRKEETDLRSERPGVVERIPILKRVVDAAEAQVASAWGGLKRLETKRQQLAEPRDNAIEALKELVKQRDKIRVPTDEDFSPDERREWLNDRTPAEREQLTAKAKQLDRDILVENGKLRDAKSALEPVESEIRRLGRVIDEGNQQLAKMLPAAREAADRLAFIDARLPQIEARRKDAIGDWPADYAQIGKVPPCFVAGTLVHTPYGVRAIETLSKGDYVMAWDIGSGELTSRRIVRPVQGRTLRVFDVNVAGGLVTATPGHRFWVPDDREWLEARRLLPGMAVQDSAGQRVEIEEIGEREVDTPTYNLLVAGEHDYFVGNAGVLVHNGDGTEEEKEEEQQQSPAKKLSIYVRQLADPPQPFKVRYYVIRDARDNSILYVGSTVQTLAERLGGHLRGPDASGDETVQRRYRHGSKVGTYWRDDAGPNPRIKSQPNGNAQGGNFKIELLEERTCRSRFERDVWELYLIEKTRAETGQTMHNDWDSPPIGEDKFNRFKKQYIDSGQLCT